MSIPAEQGSHTSRLTSVRLDNGLSESRMLLLDHVLRAITASLAHYSSCWKEEKTKAQGWGTLARNHPCVCTRHMKAAHLYFFTWTYERRKGVGGDEVFVKVFCGPTQQGIRERWWRRYTDKPPTPPSLMFTTPFLQLLVPVLGLWHRVIYTWVIRGLRTRG